MKTILDFIHVGETFVVTKIGARDGDFASHLGLGFSDEGFTFQSKERLFHIVAINPNRPKCSIGVERVSDRLGFQFPENDVAMYLKRSGP